MRAHGISHLRLMEESESTIADIAREGPPSQAVVARRVLEDTRLYQRWEAEHDHMLRPVSAARGLGQAHALRRASFGLIHRKAMFDYLRQNHIIGRDRHAVFALVFGEHDYASVVLKEHHNYMRAASSLMCSSYLGLTLMEDRAFGEPFWRYEQLYAEYFRTFCSTALSPDRYRSSDTLSTLIPYLKRQLSDLRRAILAIRPEPDTTLIGVTLNEPAANTQRMFQPFRAAG